MIGAAAGVAAVLLGVAVTLHRHNREKRAYAVMVAVTLMIAVAAWFAVVAFAPQLAAVWAYTGDGPGLVVLLIAVAGSGIAFYYHLRHRKHFHAHGTPATGVVLAVSSALAVLNIRHVSRHALSAVAGAWHGQGTAFTDVNAGKAVTVNAGNAAGHAVPATVTSGIHGIIFAGAILAGLLVAIKVARGFGDRQKKPGARPGIGAPQGPGK